MFRSPVQRLAQTTKHVSQISARIVPTTTTRAMSSSEEPTGLVAKSGIELLTLGTPNGHKVSILLEELKEVYGKSYTVQTIQIGKNTQKQPWFTAINPNGRIPAIVDHDRNDFPVFEGMAILTYLTRHYDPEHKFSFTDPDDVSTAEQWMAWQHGGLGPMQGQSNHFLRYSKERIPYPTQRYVGEAERLYGILDTRLKDRDYLVGEGKGKYSIADINSFGWVNMAYWGGVKLSKFPNLEKWWARIHARPAVHKGTRVPSEPLNYNELYLKRMQEDPEFAKTQNEFNRLADEAKEKYGYKYTSP